MVKIIEMDETVSLNQQFEEEVGAVILMNKFNVNPDEVEVFLIVFTVTTNCWELNLR